VTGAGDSLHTVLGSQAGAASAIIELSENSFENSFKLASDAKEDQTNHLVWE